MRTSAIVLAGFFLFAAIAGCRVVGAEEGSPSAFLHGAWNLESAAPLLEMSLDYGRIVGINGKPYDEIISYQGSAAPPQSITFSFGDGYTYVGAWNEDTQSYVGELTYNGELVDDSAEFSRSQ